MNRRTLLLISFLTALPPACAEGRWTPAPSPERIFEAIRLAPGAAVCEIGAGDGALSIAAARVVGPQGRVYTNELGEDRLRKLREKVAESGLSQITVVPGAPRDTGFPAAACDALFLRDVYHHFAEPEAMTAAIFAALKPGARAAVLDFRPPREAATPAGRAKDGTHGVTPESVARELKSARLDLLPSAPRRPLVPRSRPEARALIHQPTAHESTRLRGDQLSPHVKSTRTHSLQPYGLIQITFHFFAHYSSCHCADSTGRIAANSAWPPPPSPTLPPWPPLIPGESARTTDFALSEYYAKIGVSQCVTSNRCR